jgi:subtilisin family serine protease
MFVRRPGRSAAAFVFPLIFLGLGAFASLARGELEFTYYSGEVQIRLRAGYSIEQIHDDYGTTTLDSLPPAYLLGIPPGQDETAFAVLLAADVRVEAAECSWRTETPEGTRQMVVAAVGGTIEGYQDQTFAERIRLEAIHAHLRGAGVRVAILDTGVRFDHEALAGALVAGGYDFIDDDPDPSEEAGGDDEDGDGLVDEGAGHGTMVAGLVHLAAPDAEILPLRVLDDEGIGRVFALAKAIRFAAQSGAQVINLSLGLTQHTFLIQDEILAAYDSGVAIVAAAGNLGIENPAYFPALAPQVLSVASLDSLDVKSDFSNWHHSVDLSAPGEGLLAPYVDGAYALGAGTSFSAPLVAGAVALIRGYDPTVDLFEVYRLARLGSVDIYAIPENLPYLDELGLGRLDGESLWTALANPSSAPEARDAAVVPAYLTWPQPQRAGQPVRIFQVRSASGGDAAGAGGLSAADAELRVHDVAGREVRALVPMLEEAAGRIFEWDGRDARGRVVPAGVYYLRSPAVAARAHIVLR